MRNKPARGNFAHLLKKRQLRGGSFGFVDKAF